jgi:hypothetical protein
MILILPIRSGPRWAPVALSDYATSLQGADLATGCRLKNLSNLMQPTIVKHAAWEIDQATALLNIKTALQAFGCQPHFEIDGVRQNLDDEWLEVAIKINAAMVRGYRSYAEGLDPESLDAYPAWELIQVETRSEPYYWKARWAESGGQMPGGRMIALRNDPVWLGISDFGHPHPPFAFESGMDVKDISRIEAVELKLTDWRTEIQLSPCPICSA